jgi:hypothetical protein
MNDGQASVFNRVSGHSFAYGEAKRVSCAFPCASGAQDASLGGKRPQTSAVVRLRRVDERRRVCLTRLGFVPRIMLTLAVSGERVA